MNPPPVNDMRIWCLRHGESQNVVARAAGALPSAPLTLRGRRQAVSAAGLLRHEGVTHVYASTALRARHTAAIIAANLAVGMTTIPELREVGIGRAEGATDQATRARTAEVLHAWVVGGDLSQRVADGEDGHQVAMRIRTAFGRIADAHPGGAVALVGHVASLTTGLAELCGLAGQVWGAPLPHAVPFLVGWTGRRWRCDGWPGAGNGGAITAE